MQFSVGLLALASLVAASPKAIPAPKALAADSDGLKHGSSYSNSMGPVTFLYPPTRAWTEDQDNIAPCGSNAGVHNRSDFPLDDGFVAIIAKYVSTNVKVSISYKSDPKSQDDFDDWYNGNLTDEVHIGHTCFYLPDQPQSINAGDVATIQLIYENDDEDSLGEDGTPVETSTNQTFYACADIKFVEESVFDVSDYALSCFNATSDSYYGESSIQTTSASVDASQSSVVAAARSSAGLAASTNTQASTSASSTTSATGAAVALLSNPIVGVFGALAVAVNFF
jgi:hypothetical protein